MDQLFTSESVTEGHPDKVCDQISDAVLDAVLALDPRGRVACETLVKNGEVVIAGEVTTRARLNLEEIARATIARIGYDFDETGFHHRTCRTHLFVDEQSPDIAAGVDRADPDELGAGDQGMMFGYACTETAELMPLPIVLAHRLTRRLAAVRKNGKLPFLRPDGKSQVTVRYENNTPSAVDTVLISTQHEESVSGERLREAVIEEVIRPILPPGLLRAETRFLVNPTGRFVIGGPVADSGLTGRKIIVDTYGGMGRHGGGAFSGKDPSKVDRSAAYYARYIAIIRELQLLAPIYQATASYGHFGRDEPEFRWERTDRAFELAGLAPPVPVVLGAGHAAAGGAPH